MEERFTLLDFRTDRQWWLVRRSLEIGQDPYFETGDYIRVVAVEFGVVLDAGTGNQHLSDNFYAFNVGNDSVRDVWMRSLRRFQNPEFLFQELFPEPARKRKNGVFWPMPSREELKPDP